MTDDKRIPVRFTQESLEFLGEISPLSERINQVVMRYREMCADSQPEFSDDEWKAIFDANNGTIFEDLMLCGIWANVQDCVGLSEKWQVDQLGLAKKIASLSTTQQIAVQEAIQQFWSKL